MKPKMVLIGAGGHCHSVLDSITQSDYDKIVILDLKENIGKQVDGIDIVGTDDDLAKLYQNGYKNAFVALGSIGNPDKRIHIYNALKGLGFSIPCIVDSSAIVSSKVTLEEGCFVGKGAIINTGAKIGCCAIINSGSIVEHDCNIGAFVHIAPGACMSGFVSIERAAHIGTGACIIQGITIGENAIVGAGAVVIRNVLSNCTVVGNPARIIK